MHDGPGVVHDTSQEKKKKKGGGVDHHFGQREPVTEEDFRLRGYSQRRPNKPSSVVRRFFGSSSWVTAGLNWNDGGTIYQ